MAIKAYAVSGVSYQFDSCFVGEKGLNAAPVPALRSGAAAWWWCCLRSGGECASGRRPPSPAVLRPGF